MVPIPASVHSKVINKDSHDLRLYAYIWYQICILTCINVNLNHNLRGKEEIVKCLYPIHKLSWSCFGLETLNKELFGFQVVFLIIINYDYL